MIIRWLFIVLVLVGQGIAQQRVDAVPEAGRQDFLLYGLQGRPHRLSDYLGHPVVLNFWATWCEPCRQELPSLNRASALLQQRGTRFLAINWGDESSSVLAFLKDYTIDFPVLLDPGGESGFEITGLPITFLLNSKGRLVQIIRGPRQWDDPATLKLLRALN